MKLVYELKEETQRFSENSDLWYDYDNVGRVIQEDQYMPAWPQQGRMIATFAYDDKGRITDVSDFQNELSAFSYDDANLTKTVSEGQRNHVLEYDAAGQVTKKTLSTGQTEEYTYDNAGRCVPHSQAIASGRQSVAYLRYADSTVQLGCRASACVPHSRVTATERRSV